MVNITQIKLFITHISSRISQLKIIWNRSQFRLCHLCLYYPISPQPTCLSVSLTVSSVNICYSHPQSGYEVSDMNDVIQRVNINKHCTTFDIIANVKAEADYEETDNTIPELKPIS